MVPGSGKKCSSRTVQTYGRACDNVVRVRNGFDDRNFNCGSMKAVTKTLMAFALAFGFWLLVWCWRPVLTLVRLLIRE